MSFFATEEAYAVMLARVADEVPMLGTGSAGKSRLIATAQFGAKKDIHNPGNNTASELNQ